MMISRMTVIAVAIAVTLSGCAHKFSIFPRNGSGKGTGEASDFGRELTINMNGKTYRGTYVYGGGSVAVTNSFGSATAFSGSQSVYAYGSGSSTTFIPGSGKGQLLAFSDDGDAIRCNFNYQSSSGIGVCEDNKGNLYDLQIHN